MCWRTTAPVSTTFEEPQSMISSAPEEEKKQSSNVILSAIGDHVLRVVRTVIGDHSAMMKKLDHRYDYKSTERKISKMSTLMSVWYSSIREDISKNI